MLPVPALGAAIAQVAGPSRTEHAIGTYTCSGQEEMQGPGLGVCSSLHTQSLYDQHPSPGYPDMCLLLAFQ